MAIGTIQVEAGALRTAAGLIADAGVTASAAQAVIRQAGNSGDFGGEPAGAAFSSACDRAASAVGTIVGTIDQLAVNTGAAAEGYVVTDVGAFPSEVLPPRRSP